MHLTSPLSDPFPPPTPRARLHAATLVEGVSAHVAVAALRRDPSAWGAPLGLSARAATAWRAGITDPRLPARYHAEVARLARLGAWTRTPLDPEWPVGVSLNGVLRGRGALTDAPTLGVVGSRRADPHGLEIAARLARSAVERGVTVVSGGAFGIDVAAHRAALDAGGETVVVLGSGLCHPSPRAHRGLFDRVVAHGAVVSCFGCDRTPARWTFPRRNAWIAALSMDLVVVQAGVSSGALLTAREALRMNRRVWVVPGPIDAPLHAGCHRLVDRGARILTRVDAWHTQVDDAAAMTDDRPPADGRRLWDAASVEPATLADIARRAGLPIEQAMVTATMLELSGWFRGAPGARYARARPCGRAS